MLQVPDHANEGAVDGVNNVNKASFVKETPIEPPDDYNEEVVRIARQAVETHQEEGCRWDTYFYKVVLGGNVDIVQKVATYMHANNMRDTLDWLWQRAAYEETRYTAKKQLQSSRLFIIQTLLFIGFMILNVILTPVIYVMHIFTTSLLNRDQKRISGNIQLPLAYAAFSQNADMMVFFLEQGVDIEHIDKQGNNVFHYISDLSSVAAETANEIFINTVRFIDDTHTVRKLLTHHRNSAGLTAVEYSAKFGSPSLLTQILKQPNLLTHTPFAVSTDKVSFGDPSKPSIIDANTKVEFVDVTRYEAGDLSNQSALLNFLSDRDIVAMSKEDLLVFDNTELVGKWVGLKIKQMMPGVLLFQMIDIIITCILLFMLRDFVTGVKGNTFFSWQLEHDSEVQYSEISAWMDNKSYIFEERAFHNIVNGYCEEGQLDWMKKLAEEDPAKANLLFTTTFGSIHPDVYDSRTNKWTISNNTLSRKQLDLLFDVALEKEDFSANFSHLYAYRHFTQILANYAEQLIRHKDEIFKGTFYLGSTQYDVFYNNLSFSIMNKTLTLHTVVPKQEMVSKFVCVNKTRFKMDDVVGGEEILVRKELYDMVIDACYYKNVLNVVERENCDSTDPLDVAKSILSSTSDTMTDKLRKVLMIVCICVYILLDFFERCIFVRCSMSHQTTAWDMFFTVLGRKIPGSYARRQLNMFSYCGIIYQFIIEDYLSTLMNYEDDLDKYLFMQNSGTVMFIAAIVVRFLMHIHAMRLLPGIGNFVVTTFMMGTDLMHFSVVFGMVLCIFSLLFHILLDDPNCPIEKTSEFADLIDSLYATFQLTFGHGDFDVYSTNMPVKLTYVLYVIIMGLLLMNLIIAIMSTTATDIMTDPWKKSLWLVEWLDEATSVEYTFSVLMLVSRKWTCPGKIGYMSHKKAGFVVKKSNDEEWKIYVENFQCTPLK